MGRRPSGGKKHPERLLTGQCQYPDRKSYSNTIWAKGTWKSPYNFALSDGWHAPVIHRIERRKGQLRVEATDNIRVARVRVTGRDEQGQVLERGEATRGTGNRWKYTPQTSGRSVRAEARDLPENVTRLVLE